jgi:glycosyltransferase involved in cell wall biosynthesis
VIVAHVESVPLVAREVRRRRLPFLLDVQNVYSRYYAASGDTAVAAHWRRREYEALSVATVATACSLEEVEALAGLDAPVSIELAPNGVDPAEWPETALAAERSPVVAFFGALGHRPNAEGLRWMVDHVWPEIVLAMPEAQLLVFGPGEPQVREAPGVVFRGRVEDLASALGGVRVVAIPIVHGVGARVKFGEALASGAAVVSTSVGREGFDVTEGYVCADAPSAFAEACLALLRDPARAAALGQVGRAIALDGFTWERTTTALLTFARAL